MSGLWYFAGSEDSEHWFGALPDRDSAVSAGRDDYPEGFWVCFGEKMPHVLEPFDDDLDGVASAFENDNEDLFGEDGQGSPGEDWTDDQRRDLANMLNATFAQWAVKYGHHRAYMLDMKVAEFVGPELQS